MPGPARHRVLTGLRVALTLLVVVAVAVALARNWRDVSGDLRRIDAGSLALAGGLAALSPVLTMLGWRRLLADLGSPLHLAPAGGIFFVGQLGKYLPGSVWTVVAQAEMGARLRIPRRRSAVVGVITVGLAVLCGLAVGLPALPMLLSGDAGAGAAWGVALALPLLVVVFWPPLLNWGIARGLRRLRREPLEHRLSGRAVLETAALFIAAWLASGGHTLVLLEAVDGGGDPWTTLVVTVCGFALSSSLAMFSVILPAGLGVREGLLVLLLAPVASTSAAAAVVVVSRFLTVLADVGFALAGWAWARSHHLLTTRPPGPRTGLRVDADTGEGSR